MALGNHGISLLRVVQLQRCLDIINSSKSGTNYGLKMVWILIIDYGFLGLRVKRVVLYVGCQIYWAKGCTKVLGFGL